MYVHVFFYICTLKTLNMKKIIFTFSFAAILATTYSFVNPTKNLGDPTVYQVDTKSRVDFIGSKKGDFHPGTFTVKSGSLTVDAGKLTGGKFVIDVVNLKVTDAAAGKLDGHLKSPDFFDVAKFPEATFEITSVKYVTETSTEIAGSLNFKGNNIPVKFPAYIRSADDKGFFAQAFFSLDKNLLGIAYGKGQLSDDVQISVHLYAKK